MRCNESGVTTSPVCESTNRVMSQSKLSAGAGIVPRSKLAGGSEGKSSSDDSCRFNVLTLFLVILSAGAVAVDLCCVTLSNESSWMVLASWLLAGTYDIDVYGYP
jgi:hypothetical protein